MNIREEMAKELLAALTQIRVEESNVIASRGNSNTVAILESFRIRREAIEARLERILSQKNE